MKRFILLLNHDDTSLSAYLEHCLKQGEEFVKASGNIFKFKKSLPSDDRIRVVTYVSEDPDLKMKFQMEDYAALMKKRGWKVLHIGSPEDIFDSKRHIFLRTDQKEAQDPVIDPELGKKANKKETRSLIRCLSMLLLLLGFAVFFLGHDPDIFFSSNHIFFPCLAAMIFWVISFAFCILGFISIKNRSQNDNDFKNYLHVDNSVLFCMISIALIFASLMFDLIYYPDNGRIIVNGDQRIKVYQDALPITMDELEMPVTGVYRSSRITERKGALMQSLYASEESFSDPDRTDNLSFLSYSVYRSEWEKGLDWVGSRKGFAKLPYDEELARKWHSEEIHTDGRHRLAVRYPDALLVISTSGDIEKIDPKIFTEKLFLK